MKIGEILRKPAILGLSGITLGSAILAGYVVMPVLQQNGIVSAAITGTTQTLANVAAALVGVAVVALLLGMIFRKI